MSSSLSMIPPDQRIPLSDADFKAELVSYIPQARAFAHYLCRNDRALADDLLQEAVLRAWQARARFAAGTEMRAWIFTILRNAFYSRGRKAWRDVPMADDAMVNMGSVGATQVAAVELEEVRRAVRKLPTDQREALLLVTAGGLSYEEAAGICGVAEGTIKSRVNRARHALVKLLEEGAPDPQEERAGDVLENFMAEARAAVERLRETPKAGPLV